MLRLLIADDEPVIRAGLRAALGKVEDVAIVAECGDGLAALAAIETQKPDLVLLDIQMPGATGLEIVRRLGVDRMPAVIFITAYDQHAVEAFEINAVDYLLKPFDEERLQLALERARTRLAAEDRAAAHQPVRQLLESEQTRYPERLVARNGDHFDVVETVSIDWVESANNYVLLHCGARQHLLSISLTGLEQRLDPRRFVRIHRGLIVNLSRVVAIDVLPGGSYELRLRGGERLRSGRQYRGAMQQLMRNV